MAIDINDLIHHLRVQAPVAEELPRDPDTDDIDEATIQLWAEDAAQKINDRRNKTTRKEFEILTEEDIQEYDVPEDCRRIIKIDRNRRSEILDVPIHGRPILGYGYSGHLPSGQEVTASLAMINAQRHRRVKREDDFRLVGDRVRLEFPVVAGETMKVTYKAVDRTLASVPEDYTSLILKYLFMMNIDFVIMKHGAKRVIDDGKFSDETMAVYYKQRGIFEKEWIAGLNAIGPQVE